MRPGIYIVPTTHWYIERTVWLVAGVVLLTSTGLALAWDPRWILGVTATGLVSINVSFTGFCPVGNVLRLFGFKPMLGSQREAQRRYNRNALLATRHSPFLARAGKVRSGA